MSTKNDPSASRKEIYLGKEILTLIDHMALERDKEGLKLLNSILAKLTLNGVIDKQTSFIDLGEYCILLAEAIEQESNSAASRSAESLRDLIDNDLEDEK